MFEVVSKFKALLLICAAYLDYVSSCGSYASYLSMLIFLWSTRCAVLVSH